MPTFHLVAWATSALALLLSHTISWGFETAMPLHSSTVAAQLRGKLQAWEEVSKTRTHAESISIWGSLGWAPGLKGMNNKIAQVFSSDLVWEPLDPEVGTVETNTDTRENFT